MNFYDRGSIIIVKNIIFKDGVLDHAYKKGRPCLVIDINDEEITFLTLSTLYNDIKYRNDYIFENYKKMGLKKNTYVNLQNIYKTKLCFYMEACKISELDYYKIIRKLIEIHANNNEKEFLDIEESLYKQLNLHYKKKVKKND